MKTIAPGILALLFIAANLSGAHSFAFQKKTRIKSATENQTLERTLTVNLSVAVTVCIASGNIAVRGWDKSEVRAVSANAANILLQGSNGNSASSVAPAAATRVEVVLIDSDNGKQGRAGNNCAAFSDVELNVPRGAVVELKTTSGDVRIEDVSEARVQTVSGTTTARRIGKDMEAVSVSGDILLEDSSGAARFRSVSGTIEARGLNASASDELDIHTTSGNIRLERVAQARVEAATVSGSISMTGALARGGRYRFRTISGNVDLLVPSDASFQFNARVSRGGDIIFINLPLTFTSNDSQRASRLVNGSFGAGDASLTLSSFSGTLRLRRQ
ncbi:MAG: DUF4097 family beta strand repeat-containing protein [Pyrinomonadaceae bacterium]